MTTKMYAIGRSPFGNFGQTINVDFTEWTKVNDTTTWSKLYAGYPASFAIKSDGTLWFAGAQSWFGGAQTGWRQIGTDTWLSIAVAQDTGDGNWAVGVKSNGTLWFVGSTNTGIIGNGTASDFSIDWVQIGTATNWSYVAAGFNHVAALTSTGSLYTWGSNNQGRAGLGAASSAYTPQLIGTGWSHVACTVQNTLGLKSGVVYGSGINTSNIVDTASSVTTVYTTFNIVGITNMAYIDAGGYSSAVGVTTSGTIKNWGTNAISSPQMALTTWSTVRCVSASATTGASFAALKNDGTLWQWGESVSRDWPGTAFTQRGSYCTALSVGGYSNFLGLFTQPSASFTKTSVGNTVTLTNTSAAGGSYLIDWGDGQTTAVANNSATGAPGVGTLSHTYSLSSSRTITIALYAYTSVFTNGSKITSVATDTFAYTVVLPSASFTATLVGNVLNITNTSTNAVRYLIDWGDGTSNTIASNAVPGGVGGGDISHTYTYSSDSKYVTTLTAYSILYADGITNQDSETYTSTFYVTQNPTFEVVEEGTGPSAVLRNTSPNTLGATAIFGSGNKWRWDWGDGTYTDVDAGSGLPGARLVNLEHLFTFTGPEIAAQLPVTRTVTLKAYNGHASSPFSSTPIAITLLPVNAAFPNITFITTEGADIPAIFNAPKNIIWGKI